MGEAYFYHLTRNPVEATLSALLQRCRRQGWRVAVRGCDAARLEALDAALWDGPAETFLPHGLAGGEHDARQPILLTTGAATNAPDCLMALDGAEVAPGEVEEMTRVCLLFDGLDGAALARTRAQWKVLAEAGCGTRYWSEESGSWVEKATRNVGA